MKVFFSAIQDRHHTQRFVRHGNIVPTRDTPARAEMALNALREAGHVAAQARWHGLAPIAAIHTPDYLDFLRTAWTEWRRIDGAAAEVTPYIFPARGRVSGYPSSVEGRAGYHMHDLWAPIGEHTYEVALASANLAVEAAEQVMAGERAAYALCRPSGHHAFADMAGGNCFLNNAAIAAQHLRRKYGKVALVDLDVHHGNGTQGIFYARNDVLFASVHRDPVDYYPYFVGYANERGEGVGLGCNANLPLPAGSGDAALLDALDEACGRIVDHGAEALVVSLGVDAHEDDPTQGLSITYDGFRRAATRLAGLGLPTVLIQEGGYNERTIGRCIGSALSGFEDRR